MISFILSRSITIFILLSRNICWHTRYFNGVLKIQYASQTRNVDNILLNTTIIQSPFKYFFERQNVKWHETWIKEKKGPITISPFIQLLGIIKQTWWFWQVYPFLPWNSNRMTKLDINIIGFILSISLNLVITWRRIARHSFPHNNKKVIYRKVQHYFH